MTSESKHKGCSGAVSFPECDKKATVLFEDDWKEIRRVRGDNKGEVYTVPEHGMLSIRFPPECVGTPVKIFAKVIGE